MQHPHIIRKALPVDCVMLRDVMNNVDAVRLPELALHNGEWLQLVQPDCLRNSALLLVLGKVACRLSECAGTALQAGHWWSPAMMLVWRSSTGMLCML
jgi:hypothetical protein